MKRGIITLVFATLIGLSVVTSVQPTPDHTPLIAQTTPGPIVPQLKTASPTQIFDYLANPGIGWQEAHTPNSPILPETVVYKRSEYDWAAQNPGDGNYNWFPVDSDLATAVAAGKQFSFRIYTMKGPGFGGAQIPQWVLDRGATTINGRPDYSNCVYQEEWGKFVNALRTRYDGNTNIAFIDISGYGDFNEWSWNDDQTNITPGSIDAQARQRLVDMFMGGSGTVQCKDRNGQIQSVPYSYSGFRSTQLVMPYAGIQQSSRYAQSKSASVGFRHDCLGRSRTSDDLIQKVIDVIDRTWPHAPVVFEYCGDRSTTPQLLANADELLRRAHGSLTHDNFSGSRDVGGLTNILRNVGYRYLVKNASFLSPNVPGGIIGLNMTWSNVGYAPNYPKMGQNFTLHTYLIDPSGNMAIDQPSNTNTSTWLPGDHNVIENLQLPTNLAAGTYQLKVAIIDRRTGRPINLAFAGRDSNGRYPLDTIDIVTTAVSAPTATPTATPTSSPISQATPTPTGVSSPTPIGTVTPSPSTSPIPTVITPASTPRPSQSPIPTVAGVSTTIENLPATGPENNLLVIPVSLITGVILKKSFRLV